MEKAKIGFIIEKSKIIIVLVAVLIILAVNYVAILSARRTIEQKDARIAELEEGSFMPIFVESSQVESINVDIVSPASPPSDHPFPLLVEKNRKYTIHLRNGSEVVFYSE